MGGSECSRRPVAAKMALAIAGASAASGVSPMPAEGRSGRSTTFETVLQLEQYAWLAALARAIGPRCGDVGLYRAAGTDVLKVVFDQAQAHSADGTRSTIVSQPGRPIGYPSMTDYAQAGDYEGVLTYGSGVRRPVIEAGWIRIQNACFAEASHGRRPRRLRRRISWSS